MADSVTEKLRAEAKKALAEKKLNCIIGYSGERNPVPSFAECEEDIDSLLFSPLCASSLVTYLVDEILGSKDKKPVGIVVKGCDSKAIVQLLNENIISRDDVFIFGVPCRGVIDRRKLEKMLVEECGSASADDCRTDGDKVVCKRDGKYAEFPMCDFFYDRCLQCSSRNPVIFDLLLSEKVSEGAENYNEVEAIEKKLPEERWKFWEDAFSSCVRCHACKKACPLCYCEECVADPTRVVVKPDTTAEDKAARPKWVERSPILSENLVYHLTRALHMAGRCTDCGECERVCPQRLPLRKLTKKVGKDVKAMFGYEAGKKVGQKPLVALSETSDDNEFIM